MKKKDIILVGILVFAAVLSSVLIRLQGAAKNPELLITVAGKEIGRYPLDKARRIEISDTNACVIKDGRVQMVYADCPDRLCMHQKSIGAEGGAIICLPNRVLLQITEAGQDPEKPDAVAS